MTKPLESKSSVAEILQDRLGRFLLDLRVFFEGVKEDFRIQFWNGYEDRIREFNELLERSHELGIGADIPLVQPVPEGQKSAWGMPGTSAEQAKLREVVLTAGRLLSRVEQEFSGVGLAVPEADSIAEALAMVTRLGDRFHAVARQIRARHADRATLEIEDEYDVQDLFHALLVVHFDDIRPEEYTPSYAGGGSRTDFLLKNERIVIEIKKTRSSLGAKEVGAELLVDIARYAQHPDCDHLMCFVYDPEGRIANPRGVERDLEKQSSADVSVRVTVRPRD